MYFVGSRSLARLRLSASPPAGILADVCWLYLEDFGRLLVPEFEEAVPGAGADAHAVLGDPGAAHSVVVAGEDADSLSLQRVPDVAVEVVVSGEDEAS